MTLGRIGGGFIVLAAVALGFILVQPPLDIDGRVYAPDASIPFALFGLGAALVGAAGPRPLDARLTRFGVGLLALGAFAVVVMEALESSDNPMAPLTPLLIAIGAFLIGILATGLSLARSSGPQRAVGVTLLLGLLLVIISEAVGGGLASPPPMLLIGRAVAILGLAGMGALALKRIAE